MKIQLSRGFLISIGLFLTIAVGYYSFIEVLKSAYLPDEEAASREGVVGLIRIKGGIFQAKETVSILKKFRQNPKVRALLLRIDSPGGAVGPTQEIFEEILRFRKTGRKVVASVGSVAASGGYYLAVAADKIYANPGSITGSIGVVIVLPNAERALEKIGVKVAVIKSAPFKDLGSPLRPLRPEDRKIFKRLIDDTYMQFVKAVATGRRLSIERTTRLADGRIFSGERAKRLGLIDELGTLSDAAKEAGRLGGIKGEVKLVELTPATGLFSLIRGLTAWLGGGISASGLRLWGDYPAMIEYMWR